MKCRCILASIHEEARGQAWTTKALLDTAESARLDPNPPKP
jgi:hypothetical protein